MIKTDIKSDTNLSELKVVFDRGKLLYNIVFKKIKIYNMIN